MRVNIYIEAILNDGSVHEMPVALVVEALFLDFVGESGALDEGMVLFKGGEHGESLEHLFCLIDHPRILFH